MMGKWQYVPLGRVLRKSETWIAPSPEASYKEVTVRLWGRGVVLRRRVSGGEIRAKHRLCVRAGQFILSRIDARNGALGIIPLDLDGAIVSSDFPVFDTDPKQLIPAFLGWMSRTTSFVEQCRRASEGTTNRVRLNEDRFLRLEVPLPPLPEQRRIVDKIEATVGKANEARTLQRGAGAEGERIVGVTVRGLFSERSGTRWMSGTLGEYIDDACYGTSEKTHDDSGGVPILRMGNVQDGTLDVRSLRYLDIADKDRKKWILRRGDVLVNRTNSAELVGKCAVFDLAGDWGFASYLVRLRVDTTKVDPRLLVRYINSPVGRAYMFGAKKQMTGQANVNLKTLRELPLPLPALAEQRRIADWLDGIDERVARLRALDTLTSGELDALIPALLDRAFKGEA